MPDLLRLLWLLICDLFKSQGRLRAENLLLRHQLNIASRRAPPRCPFRKFYPRQMPGQNSMFAVRQAVAPREIAAFLSAYRAAASNPTHRPVAGFDGRRIISPLAHPYIFSMDEE
jgi:hypothetical protein